MKPLRTLLLFCFFLMLLLATRAQYSVSEIVTDFGGYWRSGSLSINPVKPNNSHNVLSFTYNNTRYSTGVNDSLLIARGLTFSKSDFRALPMESISGTVNSNTKVGLGEMYDGVSNGASNPRPQNSIAKYLQDGIKGLDIGTCIANLPAGTMNFPVTAVKRNAIGDGVPDLLITQTADPSASSLDRYEFTDINGNRIGNAIDIVLINILSVGNWTADFYDAHTNPMNLQGGYTRTDRAIRLWAADFSAFGISQSNISQIAYFRVTLNGNSDVAFVAYNDNTIDVHGNLLPISLQSFNATAQKEGISLSWKTSTEISSAKFVIEASRTGTDFIAIDSVAAAGTSHSIRSYQHLVKGMSNGNWSFRLKLVDQNGYATYSPVQQVTLVQQVSSMSVYPNPATSNIVVRHQPGNANAQIGVYGINGQVILNVKVQQGSTSTRVGLEQLPRGVYQVRLYNGQAPQSQLITVQ